MNVRGITLDQCIGYNLVNTFLSLLLVTLFFALINSNIVKNKLPLVKKVMPF